MRNLPAIASIIFAVLCGIAAAATFSLLGDFARQVGLSLVLVGAVPSLIAMFFALFLYQGAEYKIRRMSQSMSRGILVALMTWLGFSAIVMWAWCSPAQYGRCFSNTLAVSGVLGGGPLLIACLLSAWMVGWLAMNPPKARIAEE